MFAAKTPDDLGRYYEADGYGSHSDHFVEEFVRREQAKVELVSRFAPAGRLVEIGPGPGMFARAALRAGFDYGAIEMDPGYCRYLADELGVQAINSAAPADALATLAPSRAIVMWHAIEHLPHPADVLLAASENLQEGGVLAISTPNPDSLQFRLLGRYWAHLDAPRHLQLIPHSALQSSLARLGMRHALTTTTDPVGLECNRLGWEYAIRRHPARRSSTRRVCGWRSCSRPVSVRSSGAGCWAPPTPRCSSRARPACDRMPPPARRDEAVPVRP